MKILRFDFTARVFHWSHAMIFIWLLTTGIQLFLTSKSLLGNPLIRIIHIYASLPFVLLPVIIYISGSASLRNDVKELISWSRGDVRWFIDFLRMKGTFAAGKFNGGQKANFMASLIVVIGLLLSGSVVWMKSMFSVNFVEASFLIHDFFAVISILLVSGHIISSLYYSESLYGIVYGYVNAEWAEKHYPEWSEQKNQK
ncbi:Prokaryotic cytochrome b561 [uncultured archaeon]|nr:Prokaryotic cytochrome b561 [uncultured archaeon]